MEDNNYENVANIINEYIVIYVNKLKEIIHKRESRLLTESMNYMTVTSIVPHDFFEGGDIRKCDNKLIMKNFNNPTILFTDLKDSTEILEKCERIGRTCIYTGYIYYSSCLIADILNLVNGKIIEITGDGTYSIIEEENDDEVDNVLREFYSVFNLSKINEYDLYNYIHLVGELPYNLDQLMRCAKAANRDIRFRNFIFCIFTKFNIEINKFLEENSINFSFFTRVGCKKGPCKITRFKIDGHVHVDKLIGSTVNRAAHQAMGK